MTIFVRIAGYKLIYVPGAAGLSIPLPLGYVWLWTIGPRGFNYGLCRSDL